MDIDTSKMFEEALRNGELKYSLAENDYFRKTENNNSSIVKAPSAEEMIKLHKDEDENFYDEEDLLDNLEDDFDYQIIERGRSYYNSGKVSQVYKTGNRYSAKVYGTGDKVYDVTITVDDDYTADYECSCPCDYPCKHEYAVLMAISNKEYKEIELKPIIKEQQYNTLDIIEKIPSDELKKYILTRGREYVDFDKEAFDKYFSAYLPKYSYDYYYNKLYNSIILNSNYNSIAEGYIVLAKNYLNKNEFEDVFKIIKSIIEAYKDTDKLNFDDYVFDMLSKLAMLLRITYRKSNSTVKENIMSWAKQLSASNFYDNYYLEDIIIGLRN